MENDTVRKLASLALVAGITLTSGCVVVAKNKGTLSIPAAWHQAVAMDGKIYIVDVRTGKVSRIDEKEISEAGRFEGTTATSTIEVIIPED
jgi:hypothetical protein